MATKDLTADGYSFEETLSGVKVTFSISGGQVILWRRAILPAGNLGPLKEKAVGAARSRLKNAGAKPGQRWRVTIASGRVRCERLE